MGILFILIGLIWAGLCVFFWSRGRAKAKAAQSWPSTPGRVQRSEVARSVSHSGGYNDNPGGVSINFGSGGRRRGYGGGTSTSYKAVVVYSYYAGGVEHTSDRVAFGMVGGSPAAAQRVVNAYPVGSTPAVHYNPDNPAEAVLELKPPSPFLLFFAGGGLLFVIVGAIMAAGGV